MINKKIVEYEVCKADDLCELCDKVNEYIEDGFQPFGSIIILDRGYIIYVQPMVKYDENT